MLDFTNCKEILSDYGGSEKKIKIIINDENYLLKFPDPIREKKNTLSYVNNQFAEYIGCQIAKELGVPVQETMLGIYRTGEKEKVCVACRDFENDGLTLFEFSALANNITSSDTKYTTKIEDVYEVINKHPLIIDKQKIIDGFWNIFVVDCLIGNPDRHLDNWGIVSDKNGNIDIAPIYDCGSCLLPLYTKERMQNLLNEKTEIKNEAYNVKSVYKLNDKRIFYRDISKIDNLDFKRALVRIGNRINLDKINEIILDTPYLSDVHKEVFIKCIEIRYNNIMKKEIEKELHKSKENKSLLGTLKETAIENIKNKSKTISISKDKDISR